MRKVITYSGFLFASFLVTALFITSKSFEQLGIAVLLYPLLAYAAYELFIRKSSPAPPTQAIPELQNNVQQPNIQPAAAPVTNPVNTDYTRPAVGVVDIERRAFLKLIGGLGISLFIFSILNKRFDSLFFGKNQQDSSPSAGSSPQSPTEGYTITEIDDSIVSYFGFTNPEGAWFIMQNNTQSNSFRYSKGDSGFADNWANRENLSYDYYFNTF